VITGNWSNDMVLLIKAGKDAGLKVEWETYYGGSPAPSPRSARRAWIR
jgi:branched-chain amino acid transport system substrate-binding protein